MSEEFKNTYNTHNTKLDLITSMNKTISQSNPSVI